MHVPSDLCPLHTECFRLGTVDRGRVTFSHEAKYVDVDICIHVTFKSDLLALRDYLVQRNFDLYMV